MIGPIEKWDEMYVFIDGENYLVATQGDPPDEAQLASLAQRYPGGRFVRFVDECKLHTLEHAARAVLYDAGSIAVGPEECQECSIGHSEEWTALKALLPEAPT
jgi:hypothetical protein